MQYLLKVACIDKYGVFTFLPKKVRVYEFFKIEL
mgnify:CR=1 FL=1|jgi:hypothetical protein